MSENQDNITEYEPTLKDLLLAIKAHFLEVRKSWLLIGILAILGAIYFFYDASNFKSKYNAKLTFMVNEGDGNSMGSIASILGQFGMGGSSGEHNLDKMLSLLKSRYISEEVLLKKETINGTNDYLANHIINSLDSLDEWSSVSWLMKPLADMDAVQKVKEFRFTKDTFEIDNRLQNNVLKKVYGILVGSPQSKKDPILTSKYDENTGIMDLTAATYDESLSISLADNFFKGLSTFYVEKTTEKQRITFEVIKAKKDSLDQALKSAQYQLASFKDKNQKLFSSKSKLQEQRLMTSIAINAEAFKEVYKNFQIADFSLQNNTPIIQTIDEPISPIKPTRKSKIMSLIIGGIMGTFFAILFVVMRKLVRDALKD